jgi:transcriptional regulator GlxA family with amidase domain
MKCAIIGIAVLVHRFPPFSYCPLTPCLREHQKPVDEIGHSRTRLYRRFHEQVGMSVAAYVKQERLNAAKTLLVETSRPINVIARECGYSSTMMLRRTLQRKAGMSPRAYRQKHQAE